MQSIRRMFISLIALTFVIPAVARDVQPDPREELKTAIPEGIRLLEAKQHQAFVKSFVPPADLQKLTAGTSLEEFAKRFGEGKAPQLLKILKEIKDAKAKLDDTGTKATFALKEGMGGKKSISFVKVGKYWYIKN